MSDSNNILADRLTQGDEDAFAELITHNMGLAMHAVNRIGGNQKDDLEGEALLALTEAVNKLRTCYTPGKNVTKFLYTAINNALYNYIAEDTTVRVPLRSKRRAKSRGEDIQPTAYMPTTDLLAAPDYTLEVLEELAACAWSDSEKAVIQKLVDGVSPKAIAKDLGLAPETVQSYIRRIRNRFISRGLNV